MINTITCKLCGGNFHLKDENHYIARDSKMTNGLAQALSGKEEPKQYDAFDCPYCGCQYIAQERKRLLEISELMGDEPEEGSCEECEYLEKDEEAEPCASCNHNNGSRNNFKRRTKNGKA